MNRLRAEFGDQIPFVKLDVDNPDTQETRQQFDLLQRSRYVLVDAEGDIVRAWIGPLAATDIESAIREFLES